ncbi:MAG: septal ring lytic transglycosylase RlpA family protein [Geminicoccaceae bacterium]|nr:septal ring lytic transglycosylase RlpA family protein [Geminicoccaceae bacterium]
MIPRLAALLLLAFLAACGGSPSEPTLEPTLRDAPLGRYKLGSPYVVAGRWYRPAYDPAYDARGTASWYGDAFDGQATANGETFDKRALTAAHKTLPLPSIVEVTNLDNGRRMRVRVNDRGPFVGDRLIDLSEAAARALAFKDHGLARVRVRFLGLAPATDIPPAYAAVAPVPAPGPLPASLAPPPVAVAAAAPPAVRVVAQEAPSPIGGCALPGHFVQTGLYANPKGAEAEALRLRGFGAVRLDAVHLPDGREAERVRVGPHVDRGEAFATLARLRRLGYAKAYVVSCTS